MTMKLLKCCSKQGCRNLCEGRFCDDHEQQTNYRERGNFRERGYTSRWDKVRLAKVKKNPLCEPCLERGIVQATEIVHHIIAVVDRPDLIFNMDNLQSVCRACHGKLHSNSKEYGG